MTLRTNKLAEEVDANVGVVVLELVTCANVVLDELVVLVEALELDGDVEVCSEVCPEELDVPVEVFEEEDWAEDVEAALEVWELERDDDDEAVVLLVDD